MIVAQNDGNQAAEVVEDHAEKVMLMVPVEVPKQTHNSGHELGAFGKYNLFQRLEARSQHAADVDRITLHQTSIHQGETCHGTLEEFVAPIVNQRFLTVD